MNRAFDYKTSWLDLDGKPLVGRITFYKLHTTEKENIVDYNGTPLNNPIFTNNIGQIVNQVFLLDKKDYTIYFEKYVGTDEMETDQDNWLFQYSCDNLWDTYQVDVVSGSYQIVNNITDLRNLDPVTVADREGKKIVALGGYNEIGDKPIVLYVWNENLVEENDNGGSIVKVNDIASGRWELINNFTDGLDVRHFGVFGTDSYEDATDQMSLQIGVANTYATSIGVPLLFPSIDGLTWYKVNNLVLTNSKWMQDTRVFGNTDTQSTINVPDDEQHLYCWHNDDYKARFTIVNDIVKTSWGVNGNNTVYAPTYKLIIDSLLTTRNNTFENLVIEVMQGPVEGARFYGCEISSVGMLGDNCHFKDCILRENMFSNLTDFSTIDLIENVTVNIGDFYNVKNWLLLQSQINTTHNFDLQGRTLDSTCYLGYMDYATYKNAVLDNYTIIQKDIQLVNCNGNVVCEDISNIGIINSQVTITENGVGITNSVAMQDSTVTLNTSKTIVSCSANRSYLTMSAYRPITTLGMEYSTLESSVQCSAVSMRNCVINGAIITGVAGFNFSGCTFNAQHTVNVVMLNSIVSGMWADNIGTIANPIVINVTTGSLLDNSQQTYIYKDNGGTFLPTKVSKLITKSGNTIENYYYSSDFTAPEYGHVGFYMRDSVIKSIYPRLESEQMTIFCIGGNATYKVNVKTILTVVYNGISWKPTFEWDGIKVGDTPNVDWTFDSKPTLVPQFETYMPTVVTTTVYDATFLIEIEKF